MLHLPKFNTRNFTRNSEIYDFLVDMLHNDPSKKKRSSCYFQLYYLFFHALSMYYVNKELFYKVFTIIITFLVGYSLELILTIQLYEDIRITARNTYHFKATSKLKPLSYNFEVLHCSNKISKIQLNLLKI